jgi:predicted acetyltransferase
MLNAGDPVHYQPLGGGLVMRTAADEWDVERVAEFDGAIHGDSIAPMTRNLFLRHPSTSGRDLIFVEDEHTHQVVSSLCVIPWTLRFEGATLPAGEMGIVGTLESYRRRGLVRAQVAFFKQRLKERGCLLSHIQGIPFYYRQFGYEYALPLDGDLHLELREVPKPPNAPFTFRLAKLADMPELMRLYDEAAQDLGISAVRDEAIWPYLLTCTDGGETECENWLITDAQRKTVGYMRLPRFHFGEELMINEVSRLSADAALAALHHAKTLAEQQGNPGLRINVPLNSTLMQAA